MLSYQEMNLYVDGRSDTVTKPSPEMREAMAAAEVGDDVMEEDPTTRALEDRVAKMLNFDKALFFPTGTMANLTAVMTWCDARNSEMICEQNIVIDSIMTIVIL